MSDAFADAFENDEQFGKQLSQLSSISDLRQAINDLVQRFEEVDNLSGSDTGIYFDENFILEHKIKLEIQIFKALTQARSKKTLNSIFGELSTFGEAVGDFGKLLDRTVLADDKFANGKYYSLFYQILTSFRELILDIIEYEHQKI